MTWEKWEHPKPEPNKLKILPIIPASTSQKFPIILTSLHLLAILFPSYLYNYPEKCAVDSIII